MLEEQAGAIRILFVEDLEVDAELALYQLKRAGIRCEWRRVETEPDLITALAEFAPSVILSDFSLPRYDGMSALRIAQREAPAVPFLFLSGTIGEERAIAALHAGAVDYILKDNLARLVPAILRAIGEAAARLERDRQQAQIARLNRVLRMQSSVNSLVLHIRDRTELLRETCRLATAMGGYATAIASYTDAGHASMVPVAWNGLDEKTTQDLRAYVAESVAREASVISRVIRSGREFVCNDTARLAATSTFDSLMVKAGMRSVVALPLTVDREVIALLVLAARESEVVGDEELAMLREIAGNLSFGLQYIQRETRAHFLSHFDPQTGLAKRSLFCERVQRLLSSGDVSAAHYAIVLMDIERLSIINDSFGRRTGDLLLQQVAERLKAYYPQTDAIAHFSGGTFALVRAQGSMTEEQVQSAGFRHSSRIFSEPFIIDGRSIPVVVRTGFSLCPEDGLDATTLVQNAEAALRHARADGARHVHYNAAARTQSVGRLALEHRLRLALEREEFELHYQPKVCLRTRRLVGAEALIRWRSPEDGLVYPVVFLSLLESTGFIVPVGDWVMQQAARDSRQWTKAGLPPIRVAVNIAPAQLRHVGFERRFLQIAGPSTAAGALLDIEITEGVLQEDSITEVMKLKRLREAGVQIAIDDFGTGYSSLSRLAKLPIDTLKIDRSFVRQSLTTAAGSTMVSTVIALARAFDMNTVAEGVETQEQFDFLLAQGCDLAQGFLHSPAVAASEFAQLLQHGKGDGILGAEPASRNPRQRAAYTGIVP